MKRPIVGGFAPASSGVMIGTFLTPLARWVMFLVIARGSGADVAGVLALLIAVATPISTLTNFGLRSGYITLKREYSLGNYLVLRVAGNFVALLALVAFGLLAGLSIKLAVAVAVLKWVDGALDILYGVLQRAHQLGLFGGAMMLNGVASVCFTLMGGLLALPSEIIVWASVAGGLLALVLVIVPKRALLRSGFAEVRKLTFGVSIALLGDCWRIAVGQVLGVLVVNIPVWAVSVIGSPHDVGRFAAAAYMLTVGSLLGASLNAVLIGNYSRIARSQSSNHLVSRVIRNSSVVLALSSLAAAMVGFIGVPMFEIVYGNTFSFSWQELLIIALAASVKPATQIVNAGLLSMNRYGAQLNIYIVAVVFTLLAAVVFGFFTDSGYLVGSLSALTGSTSLLISSVVALYRAWDRRHDSASVRVIDNE